MDTEDKRKIVTMISFFIIMSLLTVGGSLGVIVMVFLAGMGAGVLLLYYFDVYIKNKVTAYLDAKLVEV